MARVRAPGGTEWVVRVDTAGPRLSWRPAQWWRERRERRASHRNRTTAPPAKEKKRRGWLDLVDVPVFDLDDAWIVLVIAAALAALIVVAVVLGFVVLPIVLVLLDLLLLVFGVAALFVWRTVTKAGWTVIAASEAGVVRRWHAPGWFAARRTKRSIASAIESGTPVVVVDAEELPPAG